MRGGLIWAERGKNDEDEDCALFFFFLPVSPLLEGGGSEMECGVNYKRCLLLELEHVPVMTSDVEQGERIIKGKGERALVHTYRRGGCEKKYLYASASLHLRA